jgi:Flp pilus assembly protein protease CpaA
MDFLLAGFLAGSAVLDAGTGRVPNRLFRAYILLDLAFRVPRTAGDGFAALGIAAGCTVRAVLTLAVLLPVFRRRMAGAADIKLSALLIGVLGVPDGLSVLFYGLSLAAVRSLADMLRRHLLRKRFLYFYHYIGRALKSGRPEPYYIPAADRDHAGFCLVPYLAAGYAVMAVFRLVFRQG